MWKLFLGLSSCVALFLRANGQSPPGGYYTTRYDHLDIENILNQKRLVHYYAACLLDRGPCTPQGVEFKRILPEALRTNCLRCTEKQRFVTLKSIRRLKKEYPDVWAELATIWDPNGEYVQQLEDSLNNKKQARLPEVQQASTNIQKIENPVRTPQVAQASSAIPLNTRASDDGARVPERVNIPLPGIAEPFIQNEPVSANTIANKPISFSPASSSSTTSTSTTTTRRPTIARRVTEVNVKADSVSSNGVTVNTQRVSSTSSTTPGVRKSSTERPSYSIYYTEDNAPPVATSTPNRISYNYDFSATIRPIPKLPANGINMVIRGVNNIIQPITDIAGRVITAGTDIAGIVLNALGVRRTY